jgi:hypothetical protein
MRPQPPHPRTGRLFFFSFSTSHMRTNTTGGARRGWHFGRPRRLDAGQGPLGAHHSGLGSRGPDAWARRTGAQGRTRQRAGSLAALAGREPPHRAEAEQAGHAGHRAGQARGPPRWLLCHGRLPLLRARRGWAGRAPSTVCHAGRLRGRARHRQPRHGPSRPRPGRCAEDRASRSGLAGHARRAGRGLATRRATSWPRPRVRGSSGLHRPCAASMQRWPPRKGPGVGARAWRRGRGRAWPGHEWGGSMNVCCVGTEGSGQAVGEGRPDKRAPQAMATAAGVRPRARVWVGWAVLPCRRGGGGGGASRWAGTRGGTGGGRARGPRVG